MKQNCIRHSLADSDRALVRLDPRRVAMLKPAHPAADNEACRRHFLGARAIRAFCAALLFTAAISVAQSADAIGNTDPAAFAFIQELGSDALKGLTSPTIPPSERQVRFRRLLNDHFDVAAISKFVLGRYWHSTSEAQREEFQALFADFIVRSYSMRFSDYMGQGIEVTGSNTGDDGTILVHSRIDMPSSGDIPVDWRLRPKGGSFAVVDVIIEGASMGVTQRSAFASIVQERGGVSGLIEALRTESLQSANSNARQ